MSCNGSSWPWPWSGGLKLLPPFADARKFGVEEFRGKMEALSGVRSYLHEIRQKYDLSILFSTHDFSTLQQYADKVILLKSTILKTGTPAEVLTSPEFRSVFHLDLGLHPNGEGGAAQ